MLVFIHIEKTGGRTVRYILRSTYGPRHCEIEPDGLWEDGPFSPVDLRRLRRLYPRLESVAGHRVTGYVDLEEEGTRFRYFTLLRDPLKMGASRYQYHLQHKRKKLPFEVWLEKDAVRDAQTKRIGGSASVDDALGVIREKEVLVGLTEAFDESLVLLKGLLANDLDIRYTSVNVAARRSAARELLEDPAKRQALIEANRADLELYELARTELFPALQREYGPSFERAVADFRSVRDHPFDRKNLTVSRLKQYGLYKPLVSLYRGRATRPVAEGLLG